MSTSSRTGAKLDRADDRAVAGRMGLRLLELLVVPVHDANLRLLPRFSAADGQQAAIHLDDEHFRGIRGGLECLLKVALVGGFALSANARSLG